MSDSGDECECEACRPAFTSEYERGFAHGWKRGYQRGAREGLGGMSLQQQYQRTFQDGVRGMSDCDCSTEFYCGSLSCQRTRAACA